ncbi:UNVERIFIED_CONTAM: hypothetical protein FKN15_070084 [Acipenser sinensis]
MESHGEEESRGPVLHIVVVGFHHKKGCQVEFSYPPLIPGEGHNNSSLPEEWKYLPFLALPDGAHNYQEGMIEHGLADSSHYKPRKSTSEDLNLIEVLGGSEDYVSVSVSDISNSNQESGGEAKETSGVNQNETHLAKLKEEEMSQSLTGDNHHLKPPSRTSPDSSESDWETLDPSALEEGAPKEETQEKDSFELPETFPSELAPSRTLPITVQPQPNTGQTVLVQGLVSGLEEDQFGLPLAVFTKGYLCLPYMALQQHHLLSDVTVRGFVAGATNILFRQQRHLSDAIVDVEEGRIHIQDPELRKVLSLTTADLRFADYLVKHVTENRDDVFLDGTGWEGGDEWIRAQFGLYLHSLLSTNLQQDNEKMLADYGAAFVNTWKITHNYRVWYSNKHPALSEITPSSVQNSERGKKLGNAVITTSRSVVQTGKAVDTARRPLCNVVLKAHEQYEQLLGSVVVACNFNHSILMPF